MSQFDQSFTYLSEYRVVICKQCQFAVVPGQILRHLRDHHPSLSKEGQGEVIDRFKDIQDIAHAKEDIRYPEPTSAPVPVLPVYTEGFQCTQAGCQYICQGLKNIQRHYRVEHRWVNPQKRGRQRREERERIEEQKPWREGVSYQRFFEYAQWKRFFEVQIQVQETNDPDDQILTERAYERAKREKSEQKQKRQIEGAANRFQPNAWLDFTGWDNHLAGFEKASILLTIKPAADEVAGEDKGQSQDQDEEEDEEREARDRGLAVACRATVRLIRKAISISKPDIVGRTALEYVNRRETGESKNERPFYAGQKVGTIRKYTDVWVKILRFI